MRPDYVQLRSPFRDVRLYRRERARGVEPRSLLDPALLYMDLDAWFDAPASRRALLELAGLRAGGADAVERARRWLESALERGQVVAVATPVRRLIVPLESTIQFLGPDDEEDLGIDDVAPAPAPPPTDFFEVFVFDAAGAPLGSDGGLGVEAQLADKRTLKANLDLNGHALIAGIDGDPPTACSVLLHGVGAPTPPVPIAAAPQGPPDPKVLVAARGPVLTTKRVLRSELATQLQAAELNATNVYQLRRRDVVAVEFEHFRPNGALFLPGPAPAGVEYRPDVDPRPDGIEVLRACLSFAESYTNDAILVVGHGASLSQARADCVKLLLMGNLEARHAWIQLATQLGTGDDQDAILAWVDRYFTALEPDFPWGSAPASGVARRQSIDAFQRAYNRDVERGRFPTAPILPDGKRQTIRPSGVVGVDTYGAMFDCYMRALRPAPGAPDAPPSGAFVHLPFIDVVRGKNFVPFQVALDAGLAADRYVEMNEYNPLKPIPGDRGWRPTYPGEMVILPPEWNKRVPRLVANGWHAHEGVRAKPGAAPPPVPPLAAPGPRAMGVGSRFVTSPFLDRQGRRTRSRAVEVLFDTADPADIVYDPREYELAYPTIAALQAREPFFVSVHPASRGASSASLFVEDGSGRIERVLSPEEATRAGNLLVWSLVPADLPNPTQLVVGDGRRRQRIAGPFDPRGVRDALAAGDTDRVADLIKPETLEVP